MLLRKRPIMTSTSAKTSPPLDSEKLHSIEKTQLEEFCRTAYHRFSRRITERSCKER